MVSRFCRHWANNYFCFSISRPFHYDIKSTLFWKLCSRLGCICKCILLYQGICKSSGLIYCVTLFINNCSICRTTLNLKILFIFVYVTIFCILRKAWADAGVPMLGQQWPAGQKAVGPTLAASVRLTDVPFLLQCRPNGCVLSGK